MKQPYGTVPKPDPRTRRGILHRDENWEHLQESLPYGELEYPHYEDRKLSQGKDVTGRYPQNNTNSRSYPYTDQPIRPQTRTTRPSTIQPERPSYRDESRYSAADRLGIEDTIPMGQPREPRNPDWESIHAYMDSNPSESSPTHSETDGYETDGIDLEQFSQVVAQAIVEKVAEEDFLTKCLNTSELKRDNQILASQVRRLLQEKRQLEQDLFRLEKESKAFKRVVGNLYLRME